MRSGPDYTVAALKRGLSLMQVVTDAEGGLTLSQLAEKLKMPVPSVFRYVRTLEGGGFLQVDENKRYRSGPATLTLGFATLAGMDILQSARMPLQRLAAKTGETVNLGVLVDGNVLYLHRIKNRDILTADVRTGSSLPAACTSLGKALLARLSDVEIRARVSDGSLTQCEGPNAHKSVDSLLADMAETRRRGWSIANQELFSGLRSIGAAIVRPDGQTVGAINITVLATTWTMEDLIAEHLDSLLGCVAEISGAPLWHPGMSSTPVDS